MKDDVSAASLGINLAAGIAVFSLIGIYLDNKRGGGYAFTITGIALGFLYGGYEVFKFIRRLEEEEKKDQKSARP